MNVVVFGAIALGLILIQWQVTRWVRLNRLAWIAIWWIAVYLGLALGINPPLPVSIIVLFMAILTLALGTYLTADADEMASAKNATVAFIVKPRHKWSLLMVSVALPLFVALQVYSDMTSPPQAPVSGRTIHPPPPGSITYRGRNINLTTAENPYRELEHSDPEAFEEHVANGRRIYFESCFYCHGDNMQGAGMFAHGYDPLPANFNDATTIAMLQESYLFWRIAKGAPGLPSESTPWSSAMPAWEPFLTEEEVWDVIIFLYDFTGFVPRASGMEH